MISKETIVKSTVKSFNECISFKEQIDYLRLNSHCVMLYLDNDGEYVGFVEGELVELAGQLYDWSNPFNDLKVECRYKDYLGNTDGVMQLLEYIGIRAEFI